MTVNAGENKIPTLSYPTITRTSEIYITDQFLDEYVFALALTGILGPGADVEGKSAAIVRAQIYIEALSYVGNKWWSDQILQWPRYPVRDKSGYLVDSESTPWNIFNACAEAAYQEYISPGILQGVKTEDTIYPLQSKSSKAGSVSTSKSYDTDGKYAMSNAQRFERLQGYLSFYLLQAGVSIPLIRT